jgi:exonuclease III
MKIVSWNCHYGFDGNKPEIVKKFDADILVIPECREIDMEVQGYDKNHRDWYGDGKEAEGLPENIRKERDLGIGVFWKDSITVEQLPVWKNDLRHNSDFRYLVPYKIGGSFSPFILITVWTKNKTDASDPLDYVQKAHAAVDHYKSIGLLDERVIIIGDFNSNIKWDSHYRKDWNHSALVKKLKEIRIQECVLPLVKDKYHTYCYNNRGKDYLVVDDYCFASNEIASAAKFSVPADGWVANRWHGSDHCPICVEFDI